MGKPTQSTADSPDSNSIPNPTESDLLGGSSGKKIHVKKDKNGAIYANIRGLYPQSNKTKVPYLSDLAKLSNAPYICLTETHLNPDIIDAEIQLENYTLFRSDRNERSHGGVAIYVRNDLAATMILNDSNSYCDSLVIEIHKLNLILINIYRPPKCPKILFNQTLEAIKVMLQNIESESSTKDILIC